MTPQEKSAALVLIASASVQTEIATGCPAAISAAQAIVESGWLRHMPPGSQNCFGIKDTDRFPDAVYSMTTEWEHGQLVAKKQAFEKYPNLAACFTDHAKLITGGFGKSNVYAPAWAQYGRDHDVAKWVAAMGSHYSPGNASYAPTILAFANAPNVQAAIETARKLAA